MEIKQGDTVRVSKDAPKLYAKGWLHDWCKTDSIVKEMDNEDAVIAPINRPNNELAIPCKYLVKVDAEAKEATEEKKLGSITEETIKDKSYWDAYTADLAKEIALKVANKFNGHEEVAEYAVSVAKAVVEELKRK